MTMQKALKKYATRGIGHWALVSLAGLTMGSAGALAAPPESMVSKPVKYAATVHIDAFQFQPELIRIKRGQTVLFVNQDSVPHTVTPGKKSRFTATGIIRGGEQHAVLFEAVGKQDYSCDFHPSMLGWIVVE